MVMKFSALISLILLTSSQCLYYWTKFASELLLSFKQVKGQSVVHCIEMGDEFLNRLWIFRMSYYSGCI